MTTPGAPMAATGYRPPIPAKPLAKPTGPTGAAANKFIAARRAANQANQDPYNQIIAGMPQPQSQAQIQSQAQGEIGPLVAAIIASITGQTKSAVSGITGYSNDAASKLAAINYGAPYQQAEGDQAAVDQTLASSLAGQGQTDANSLQSRLAVLNDPSVAAAAANVSANGTGAANADTAQGTGALTNLIANAAAANSYGQKLPGIQRAQGLQDIAGVEQTANNNIATGTQAAEGQLPSILQNLQAENDNRSSAIASARQNQLARNDNIAAGTASNQVKVETVNANNATKVEIAQMNQNGKVSNEQLVQARSDRTYRLQFTKTYGYDPVTGRVAPGFKVQGGQIVKTGVTKAGSVAGLSPIEVQKYRGLAATIADQGFTGFTDTKGVVHPALTRDQAIEEAQKEGIPDSVALVYINAKYGRPGGKPIVQPQKKGDIGIGVVGANGQVVK